MSSASTGTDDQFGAPEDHAGGPNDRRAAAKWRDARVVEVAHPAVDAVVLRLAVPERVQHLPGQHYVVRLRAPDGYTAQRSYSVASAPGDELVELFVERIEDGEVSGYLADVVEPGDELEVRGPIGRWFVWDTKSRVLCLVGGTGVVPAVAMARTARRLGRTDLLRIAAMGRTPDDLAYAPELGRYGATFAFTRAEVGDRLAGPFTAEELAPLLEGVDLGYVCGSARFASYAEDLLIASGLDPVAIRVERFGPTGD